MVEKTPYDLVLMDLQMPEMDGLEATRIIRQHKNAAVRDVPIVALTAHAGENFRQECLTCGMNDYTVKPIRQQILFETISRWIKR